jgi:MFS family permease
VGSLSGVETHRLSALRVLLGHRAFGLMWASHASASLADAAISLTLLLVAYRSTGSTAAVALVAMAVAVPQLLVGLPAGVLVDRWSRRRVMVVSDLLRAAIVLGAIVAVDRHDVWLLAIVGLAQASVGTFLHPARGSMLPDLVGSDRLLPANSLMEMTRVVAGVLGVAAAGFVAALSGGSGGTFVIGAGMFALSALFIAGLPGGIGDRPSDGSRLDIRGGVIEAIQLVVRSRIVVGLIVAMSVVMLGLGAVNVLLVPFVVDDLRASEAWFGALRAAQVFAMILAAGLVAVLSARLSARALVSGGVVGLGMVVAALAAVSAPWDLLLLLFAAGWFITPVQAAITTILQSSVPRGSLGRAHASLGAMASAASLASIAVAGLAAEALGTRAVFSIAGALAIAAGLSSWAVFRSSRGRSESEAPPVATEPAAGIGATRWT